MNELFELARQLAGPAGAGKPSPEQQAAQRRADRGARASSVHLAGSGGSSSSAREAPGNSMADDLREVWSDRQRI